MYKNILFLSLLTIKHCFFPSNDFGIEKMTLSKLLTKKVLAYDAMMLLISVPDVHVLSIESAKLNPFVQL